MEENTTLMEDCRSIIASQKGVKDSCTNLRGINSLNKSTNFIPGLLKTAEK